MSFIAAFYSTPFVVRLDFRMPSVAHRRGCLTLSLPRVINFNFLFQSLTRDISYSMENLPIDSLLR